MKRLLLVLACAVVVAAAPVDAHHSFAAYYYENQSITVEGELIQFEYKSPHAWVRIQGKDERGETQTFSAEWSNPNRLKQQGVTKDTFKPGDRLILTGSPGRNPENHQLHLKSIQRPSDGWRWGGGRR